MNPVKQKRIQEIFKRRIQKTPPANTDIFIVIEPDVSVPCPLSLVRSGFFAIILLGLQLLCGASQTIRRCWPLFAALLLIGTGLIANTQPVSACDTNPAPAMRPIEQIEAAAPACGPDLPTVPIENAEYLLNGISRVPPSAQRKRSRTRAEVQRERQLLWDRTSREVDALVADFHARLTRAEAKAIGAVYARYSSKRQASVVDQIRTILEWALKERIFVPRELVFFDLATRGVKKNRIGLSALQKALKNKEATVALFFSTSRLFRKAYRTLEFVDTITCAT